MLEVCLCKPAIYKLKILGGGSHKKGGTKFLKLSGGRGGAEGEEHNFWLKFSGDKNFGGNSD